MAKLTRSSKIILSDLIRARRPLPIKKLAERNSMHWMTVNNNIKSLQKSGYVKCIKTPRRTYCEISPALKKRFKGRLF